MFRGTAVKFEVRERGGRSIPDRIRTCNLRLRRPLAGRAEEPRSPCYGRVYERQGGFASPCGRIPGRAENRGNSAGPGRLCGTRAEDRASFPGPVLFLLLRSLIALGRGCGDHERLHFHAEGSRELL